MGKLFLKGLLILIPLIFVIFILSTAFDYIQLIFKPFEELLPSQPIFGFAVKKILTVITFILIVLILGLITNSKFGQWILKKGEVFVPGFILIRTVLFGNLGREKNKMKACIASIDDAWLFGFIIEEHESGMLTIFIPSAPAPTGGNIYFMNENQIKRIEASPKEVIKYIMQFGFGSKNILDGKVKW
jgi:uncharacterized membrane protein